MTLTIKLVRHGQSTANVGLVNSWEVGDHSIELTERGHSQAREAGSMIGHQFFTRAIAYSSPFRRARQTLDGLLEGAGVSPAEARLFEDPRLREVEHGYANVPEQRELQTTHGKFYYRFHGGESPADCYDRTSGFLEGLMRQVARKKSDRVVIVTHGLTIRCFVMRFLHLTVEQFDSMENPANCDVISIGSPESIPEPAFVTSRWAVGGLTLTKSAVTVSRESARSIAAREIVARGLGSGVRAVYSLAEVERPPTLYAGPDLRECWLAYADRDSRPLALQSSNVVIVDRRNGAVLYAGSANDEG